jgi:hypothetical protein
MPVTTWEVMGMPQTSMDPNDRPRPPIPGWVKGFAVVGLVILALAGAMLATGHGPGRHFATAVGDPK